MRFFEKFQEFSDYSKIENFRENVFFSKSLRFCDKIENFLKKCYKDKKLLKSYESMKEMYNIEKKGDNLFLLNTLRMISVDY